MFKSILGLNGSSSGSSGDPTDPEVAARNRRLAFWVAIVVFASVLASYFGRWHIYPAVFKK
ncbi:MAG: hypothetical protein KGR26_05150 [Cyanobacteria bacterium REEB65]|nr:hypothetical protein [Cyanobacteria bacterium REEB65]